MHLLGAHVAGGGRATVIAPAGPLSLQLRAAGIETVPIDWSESLADRRGELREALTGHQVAIVHWDHEVMYALDRAREVCGRAILSAHQMPLAMARWFGPEVIPPARELLAGALEDARTCVVVRGEWHRGHFERAFGLRADAMLPAAIPIPPEPPAPAAAAPGEILALMRFSPEKEPVARLAVELTRARLRRGSARLAIAGEGPWREEAIALCRDGLPPGRWRIEPAPADPTARLASADLVVAQGLTTLEAAALERRVIVARLEPDGGVAGAVLAPGNYAAAAGDPFGRPRLSPSPEELLDQARSLSMAEVRKLRELVVERNSLAAGTKALAEAIATTAERVGPGPTSA
jgi:hypothetical protein